MHEQVNYDLANSAMPAFNLILFFIFKKPYELVPKSSKQTSFGKDLKRQMTLNGMNTYGGITAISRSPSALGFKPNGDETIAFSNCFRA